MLTDLPFTGFDTIQFGTIRSEDVRFSPSGKRLAVVATDGILLVFTLKPSEHPLRITGHVEIHSNSFYSPHGVDFISEDTVAVANRGAALSFFRIPPPRSWPGPHKIKPVHEMTAPWIGETGSMRSEGERTVMCGLGAVRVQGHHVFVTCNKEGTLSKHPFSKLLKWIRTGNGQVISRELLSIPDSVAISRDRRWVAVGEHESQCLVVHEADGTRIRSTHKSPKLSHPHGICFDPSGKMLFVADAGKKDIHIFRTDDDWKTSMEESTYRIEGIPEDLLQQTKDSVPEEFRPLEGGVKGLDLDPSGRIMATTCKHQLLRFFYFQPGESF